MAIQLDIKCKHITENVPTSITLADYYPLSKEEVGQLLTMAAQSPRLINEIQIRLCQAVPGATCPYLIEGRNAERTAKLERLYVDGLNDLDTLPNLTDEIFQLISN